MLGLSQQDANPDLGERTTFFDQLITQPTGKPGGAHSEFSSDAHDVIVIEGIMLLVALPVAEKSVVLVFDDRDTTRPVKARAAVKSFVWIRQFDR